MARSRYGRGSSTPAPGATYAAITDALNRDSLPTAHGAARWRPSTVAWALRVA